MKRYIEVNSIEELKKVLSFFKIEEDFEKTTTKIWEQAFPLYYSTDDKGEVFCTNTKGDNMVVPFKLFGEDYMVNREPYTIMAAPGVNPLDVGKTISAYLQIKGTKKIYYNNCIFKKVTGNTLAYTLDEKYMREDIISLKNPFDLNNWVNEKYKISDIDLKREFVRLKKLGDKEAKSFSLSSVYVDKLLRRKAKEVKIVNHNKIVKEFDIEEIKEKVRSFYSYKNIEVSDYLLDSLQGKILDKQLYIPYIFESSIDYTVGDSEYDRNIILTQAPQFKEMLTKLETLGFSMEKDSEGIFKNSLFFKGKNRKVTSILASQKLGRYDGVYNFFKKTFKEKVTLSINPYEMVRASHNYNSTADELGGSCFRADGCYHASVWAYIGTKQCAILKLKDKDGKTSCRMWVSFDNNAKAIVFGRKYGYISKTQIKMVRLCLEARYAEWLKVENAWKFGRSTRVNMDYGSGFYWDTPTEIIRHKDNEEDVDINFDLARNSEGDESSDGKFNEGRCHCACCEETVDETRYLDHYSIEVCDNCLDEYYRWSDSQGEYVNVDDAIYIEDLESYDFDSNSDDYYYIDDGFYKEIPDNYVVDYNGEIIPLDDSFYCYFADEYYHVNEESVMVFLDNGDIVAAYEDNIPSEYIKCEECGVYFHCDFEQECPNCKTVQEVA